MHARGRLGALGEELAAAHLQRLGFHVLERNVRTRYGEIDLIVSDGHTLVFVGGEDRCAAATGRRLEAVPLDWLRHRSACGMRRLAARLARGPQRDRPRPAESASTRSASSSTRGRALLRLEHLEGAW